MTCKEARRIGMETFTLADLPPSRALMDQVRSSRAHALACPACQAWAREQSAKYLKEHGQLAKVYSTVLGTALAMKAEELDRTESN